MKFRLLALATATPHRLLERVSVARSTAFDALLAKQLSSLQSLPQHHQIIWLQKSELASRISCSRSTAPVLFIMFTMIGKGLVICLGMTNFSVTSSLRTLRHPRCPCAKLLSSATFNQPQSSNDVPRPGGIPTFMRLPYQPTAQGLDVCFLGIPLDCGTSNRAGTRFGPRQIRNESSLLRPCNSATGMQPFNHLQTADVGDVPVTLYNLQQAVKDIKNFVTPIVLQGCKPLTMGGDHTITYPLLQAINEKYGPVGLIHVDAHADVNDTMMGCKLAHGTTFRRAAEDGLLDMKRVIQIGIRGTRYTPTDFQWALDQGFKQVLAEECWHKSLTPLMKDVKQQMGHGYVYVSLDIDALDPAFAPGTGTPEIGGLSTIQMLEIIRGCQGLQIVGGDIVEVSPPYDPSGNTALTAANMLFELLCVILQGKRN